MKIALKSLFLTLLAALICTPATAFDPDRPECMVAAKSGGGMDISCRLVAEALYSARLIDVPMTIKYKSGGIGAVAYNHVAGIRSSDPQLIVAASSGSVLNIATGKFGNYDINAVRWLGAVAADYGVIAVRSDSPWNSLTDLIEALRQQPFAVKIGGSGSAGSQDWMKTALLIREIGIPSAEMRYVGFEGPSDASDALLNGYIDIFPGDAAELLPLYLAGKIRLLAVLAPERLPAPLAHVPTAREHGYLVDWTIWRGFYMGPQVSEESYQWWLNTFRRMLKTDEFMQRRTAFGLYPYALLGQEFQRFIEESVAKHKELASAVGLLQ